MITLTTPHRHHTYERGPRQFITEERRISPCRTLKDILTSVEEPLVLMHDWFAIRETTGERITLETPLQDGDSIILRKPTNDDLATSHFSRT